jgi:D-alanyl-D-alanine carboxypeptidase
MKLDTEMDVSERASEQAPTKLGLRPGQTIRVEDAIKGLVTRSANDAAGRSSPKPLPAMKTISPS